MSNLTEEEHAMLEEAQYKELMEYYDIEKSWEDNPIRIKLEKQLEEIHQEIDSKINWIKEQYDWEKF